MVCFHLGIQARYLVTYVCPVRILS
jgi:hypothetical protein